MSKELLRRELRARIATLGAGELAAAGAAVADRLLGVPQVAGAGTVLLYSALPREVPTAPLAEQLRARGITLTYPRCLPETREMTLHRVAGAGELQPGSYGIAEPAESCPLVSLAEVEVALVPGLAWDRRGGRLGRGAGYYDRLLGNPQFRGVRCGIFFSAQEVERVPMDPWDVPLDLVVTEGETVWPSAK